MADNSAFDDEWEDAPVAAPVRRTASAPMQAIPYIEPPASTTMADLPPDSATAFADASILWVGWHDGMTRVGPFPADADMSDVMQSFPLRSNNVIRMELKKFPFLTWEPRWGYNWLLTDLAVKLKNETKQTEEEKERGELPRKPDGFVLFEALNEWGAALGRTPVFCTK